MRQLMRNYSRVYHTSLDYLAGMPMGRLVVELGDAAADIAEENRQHERRMREMRAKGKNQRNARPKRRRR